MPSRVTDAERARIVEAVEAGRTRNDIARSFERSPSTISKIASDEGLSFDRSQTQAATKAKQADNRAWRAEFITKLQDDAEHLRKRFRSPITYFDLDGRTGGVAQVTLDEPTPADQRNLAGSLKMILDSMVNIERVDKPGAGHGIAEQLVENLAALRDARASD